MKSSIGRVPIREGARLRIATAIFFFFFAGWLSSAQPLDQANAGGARYLDQAAVEKVILTLQTLPYPLSRAETFARLGLADRRLPSLRSISPDTRPTNLDHVTHDHELIHLTPPTAGGRPCNLRLWYDATARVPRGRIIRESEGRRVC